MEFEQYLFNQGEVINHTEVSIDTIEKYKGILPEQVIELWKTYGFSGISKGLFQLVDPIDGQDIVNEWSEVNEILGLKNKKLHLIAISAFGNFIFYVEKEEGGQYFTCVDVLYNNYEIMADELEFFFDILIDDETFVEEYFSESLFQECYAKLGALEEGECYGFVPLPVLGGDMTIEYAQKVKIAEYLSICAQAQMQ